MKLPKVVFVVSVLLLFLSFSNNLFNIIDDTEHNDFENYSESLIIGKLMLSQLETTFAKGGLTGRIIPELYNSEKDGSIVLQQYDLFKSASFDSLSSFDYSCYLTQIGGQGLLYSSIQHVLPISNSSLYFCLRKFNAFFISVILSVIICWVLFKYGWWSSVTLFLTALLSPWFVKFSPNMWWCLWSFFLPFVFSLYSLKGNKSLVVRWLFFSLGVFLKCFFTGYEYITTSVIMGGIPVIIYDYSKFSKLIKESLLYSFSVVIGVAVSMMILITQISVLKGSLKAGVDHLIFSYKKRSSGEGEVIVGSGYSDAYNKSLNADLGQVLDHYLGSKYFFDSITGYHMLLVYFIGLTFSLILFKLISDDGIKKKLISYNLVMIISLIASFSWYIIFKGHSYIHKHMNQIVFMLPFGFFVFSYIAFIGKVTVSRVKEVWSLT